MTMGDLVVELYGSVIGKLVGDWRTFDFVTDPGAAQTFGIDSPILSVAIPLAPALGRIDGRTSSESSSQKDRCGATWPKDLGSQSTMPSDS